MESLHGLSFPPSKGLIFPQLDGGAGYSRSWLFHIPLWRLAGGLLLTCPESIAF